MKKVFSNKLNKKFDLLEEIIKLEVNCIMTCIIHKTSVLVKIT